MCSFSFVTVCECVCVCWCVHVCIAYCHHQMPDIIFLYHQLGVDSKATKSVPSPVRNLKEEAPDMTYDSLVKVIGQHFMGDEKEKVC